MKNECCVCGKGVRFSILLGDTGQRLNDGAACYDCCKIAGYGKGVISAMGLALLTKAEFIQQYNDSPKAKKRIRTFNSKNQASAQARTYNDDYSNLSNEALQKEMSNFIVLNAGINLQHGEVCYFSSECYSVKYKDVVVGTSRSSSRLGGGKKGLYVSSGISQQTNNRQIVSEKYPGHFYVTNKRMICNTVKLSFEIPLTKISTMTTYADSLTILSAGKSYNVMFEQVEQFKKMIQINNEIEKRRIDPVVSTPCSIKESDVPKIIREYKSLFDDGIISEDEFNQKKEQLLSGNITSFTEEVTTTSNNSLEATIRNMFTPAQKVQAIKYVRETTGLGLKEAKEIVDSIF